MILPHQTLKLVSCAASRDDTRYVICGVRIEPRGKDELVLAATNGRLAIAAFEKYPDHGLKEAITVPTELIEAIRFWKKNVKGQLVGIDLLPKNRVELTGGKFGITGALIDGVYPPWREVIKPRDALQKQMPGGISASVLDVIFKAQATYRKRSDCRISDVYGCDPLGVHYMQLTENSFVAFMGMRGDEKQFNYPDWAV